MHIQILSRMASSWALARALKINHYGQPYRTTKLDSHRMTFVGRVAHPPATILDSHMDILVRIHLVPGPKHLTMSPSIPMFPRTL